MRFATAEVSELQANWSIRAYAKLADGTYVYTDVYTYTIYDVADALYREGKMGTQSKHEYLYNKILTKVNKDYVRKDFDWTSTIVGA